MNFIYVIHLICWNYLIDLITVAVNAVASVLAVSVSVVCDQVDQVVPAHQVDDINEVHELDPVHQVDHKDEYTSPHITAHHIISYHIVSYHIIS